MHLLLSLFPLLLPAAQDEHAEPDAAPAEASSEDDSPTELTDELEVREHVLQLEDGPLAYESRTGRLVLREESGEARAAVFYVHYRTLGEMEPESRPLTFCFNGGPGSSSVWLHLGAFGPRRVDLGPEGFELAPPPRLVANPHTLLVHSDLVFVDPVTTGYSRAADGVDDSEFHGDRKDVESVAEFIRLFLTRAERWTSPIFLAGESYGTTRAAALAQHLETRHGIYPCGLVLVSSILNFQTARFDVGNDLPYALFLPTYTAIAHFHGRLAGPERPLADVLTEVEAFAMGEYWSALAQGDRLGEEPRRRLAERLAFYTGLSPEYVLSTDLRIRIDRFVKELRRDEGVTVGRLDGRYVGNDRDSAGEGYEYDPSYAAIQGPYTMALNHYVRTDLGFESDLPYEILTGRVRPWDYERAENEYLNVAEDLRSAIARNRALQVYVANGLYDLATPYFATRYTFDHLGLPEAQRDNVRMGDYLAGHMMYVREADLAELTRQLREFYADTVPAR